MFRLSLLDSGVCVVQERRSVVVDEGGEVIFSGLLVPNVSVLPVDQGTKVNLQSCMEPLSNSLVGE